MEPEAVLELMSSAPRRYEMVRSALRYRGDGPSIKVLREGFSRSEAYRRTFGLPGARPDAPSHPEPDGPFGWRCRVWLIDHDRWHPRGRALSAQRALRGARMAAYGHGRVRVRCAVVGSEQRGGGDTWSSTGTGSRT